MSEPIHISDAEFEKVVMQSDVPVIVDFWAPWCNPCKMIAPTLDKLANEMGEKIVIAKVNTDDHAEWMQKFGIQGIPTLLFVSGGKVVHRQVGALPEKMLRDVVNQFLSVVGQN
ncbi:MAG: thioredoxin [Anaerolineales bacterium]|nr:thioredoxin [Anaerolineales bacterium]MBL8098310.1 thioredoxin [Anaerolineales bacterium]MBX3038903.1 thioredoxin [Anaerolineales bacterium]